jgi:2'-5' RNA ligase
MTAIRFVIISVPGGETHRRLETALNLVRDVGQTETAARYPPHVTLRTGAMVPLDDIDRFSADFQRHIGVWAPFKIETGAIRYESSGVDSAKQYNIYYPISPQPQLVALHRHLLGFTDYIKHHQTKFQPHLSLAYDDLSHQGFAKIQHLVAQRPDLFLERFQWQLDNISLYHCINDRWIPYRVFYL